MKITFLSYFQYTHSVASWLLGLHDTLPCVLIMYKKATCYITPVDLHWMSCNVAELYSEICYITELSTE